MTMSKYMTIGCEFGRSSASTTEDRFEFVIVKNADDTPEKKLRKIISQWLDKVYDPINPDWFCNKTYLITKMVHDDQSTFVRQRLNFLGNFILLDFNTGDANTIQKDGSEVPMPNLYDIE